MLLSPSAAAKHYDVSVSTLREWEREGKIRAVRTQGGHRRYEVMVTVKSEAYAELVAKVTQTLEEYRPHFENEDE